MTYTPRAEQLGGLPIEEASCFGMPHIGARYLGADARSNRLDDGALCAVCGRPATNSHHEPPLGMGGRNRAFLLRTARGSWTLTPALVALCGSGTTGCHGMRHSGRLRLRWAWASDGIAEQWWDGRILAHRCDQHDPALLGFGRWEASLDGGEWRPL